MARSSAAARLQAVERIYRAIAGGAYPSATELGELLGVTPKTARAYLAELGHLAGADPVYDPIQHGYFFSREARPKLIPRLTDEEVIALFLLEETSRTLKDSPVHELIESVLDKLSLMLPVTSGLTLDQVSSALSLRMERAASIPGPDPEILRTLYTALVRHRQVRIEYRARTTDRGRLARPPKDRGHLARSAGSIRNPPFDISSSAPPSSILASDSSPTRRTIDPLHLTRCEGQWYLIAFCHLRKAIRTFVPARIRKVHLLPSSFTPPVGFDPDDHFRTAFGIVSGFNVAEVVMRFDAEAAGLIRERRWHATQILEELPGGEVRLRMTCSQGQELLAWLLSWGGHVRVESPRSLAKEVREAHRRAALAPTRERADTSGRECLERGQPDRTAGRK